MPRMSLLWSCCLSPLFLVPLQKLTRKVPISEETTYLSKENGEIKVVLTCKYHYYWQEFIVLCPLPEQKSNHQPHPDVKPMNYNIDRPVRTCPKLQ